MKIIVGLGNPGKEYEKTRHNAGFMFLDILAKHPEILDGVYSSGFTEVKKFKAEILDVNRKGERIVLIKPQTFMNSSGQTVSSLLEYYKVGVDDLIVVNDDIDLPVGMIRVREGGASAGQKGLQNIIDTLGTEKFTRFRIGISQNGEKQSQIDTVNFVLGRFNEREKPLLEEVIGDGANYLLEHLGKKDGIPAHSLSVIPQMEKRVEE